MEAIASSSKKSPGFSLIEVLISVLLVAIILLALLEAVTVYTQQNMTNILRDEAVRVTQDFLYDMRTQNYTGITVGTTGTITSGQCTTAGRTVTKKLRSTDWTFRVCWSVTEDLSQVRKTVTAITSWTFLNQNFSHQSSIIVAR